VTSICFAIHHQAARAGFEDVGTELQLLGAVLRRIGTAQQGLHPRHQFAAAQRLDQVVVGAGGDAGHDVVLGALPARNMVGVFGAIFSLARRSSSAPARR
jgi:hypothetical protein